MGVRLMLMGAALAMPVPLAAQQAIVVNAGSEQALRVGKTTISRPFGATLVDALHIAGAYRLGSERLWLVRGDGDATCPSRYIVVTRRSAEEIVASDPFGTCGVAGTARVERGELIVPFAAPPGSGTSLVRFAYRAGQVRRLDAGTTPLVAGASAPAGCVPASRVSPDEQAATIAAFEASFPAEYGSMGKLRKAEFAPAALRDLVVGLACLSTWPAGQRVVPQHAMPLFASKRWGPAAFTALDTVSRDPATDANMSAAIKSFAAEMAYRVARRTTI